MPRKAVIKVEPQYAIGIPGIDTQRKELFIALDSLLGSLEKNKPRYSIQASVEELLSRLNSHFAIEEALFEIIGFPGAAGHKARHSEISNHVREVLKCLGFMENAEIERLAHGFRAALLNHIASSDSEYVSFIDNLMTLRKKFGISAVKSHAIAG